MWSSFYCNITPWLQAGQNYIGTEVWKPGLRFPIRECLAGFLPDVATTFGGIWQDICVRKMSQMSAQSVLCVVDKSGNLLVEGKSHSRDITDCTTGRVTATVDEKCVTTELEFILSDQSWYFRGDLPCATLPVWQLGSSNSLVHIDITVGNPEVKAFLNTQRITSIRNIAAQNTSVILNGHPIHLREILDWGWHPTLICPSPSRKTVADQITKARALGFNMIKLCLFVPDENTFTVADEMGMPLWVELPMWPPEVTPEMTVLALREYDSIMCRIHHHPSILLVSLGCEVRHNVTSDVLSELDRMVSYSMPNVLRCDNNGSAVAYGGISTSISDFHDYHFYTDPHYFESVTGRATRLSAIS